MTARGAAAALTAEHGTTAPSSRAPRPSRRCPTPSRALAELAADAPAPPVADLYVAVPTTNADDDAVAVRLGALFAAHPLPSTVQRVTATVAAPTAPSCTVLHLPARRAAGFTEDRLIRGLHPQIAQRLQLGRLREFDLTRLPSADEEIYLFKAVARSNPADERLIAMGQVRDLTPLRDDRRTPGRAARTLEECRHLPGRDPRHPGAAAAGQAARHQPVPMYVWPPIDLSLDELNALVQRIAPPRPGPGWKRCSSSPGSRTRPGSWR